MAASAVAPLCLLLFLVFSAVSAEDEYNRRCICWCPNPSYINGTIGSRLVFREPVPAKDWYVWGLNCNFLVLPRVADLVRGHEEEFCLYCECKYENRNSTTIKVVVILVIWVISLLVVYMTFLLCLDPLLNKRRAQPSYQEHTNECEDSASVGGAPGMSQRMHVRPNVLGRVGHQQDKWKRQVQEQRYNIYDKHTMLN
ncbi:hypothetical protein GWK47_006661 [Chionoecetes opilio]|uniref:Transmembrane protein 9 n=1 Tax=Chionoecetes opilio TaxID=41210 RepID=A0A8J5CUS6_CHIOP|nr:hypothetical protein GWK47_006661 [Chionoecetes opilio]